MKNIIVMANRAAILIYTVCFLWARKHIFRIQYDNSGYLFLFPGSIGSMLLFLGILEQFGKQENNDIEILCKQETGNFIEELDRFNFCNVDGSYTHSICYSFKDYRRLVRKYKRKGYSCIANVSEAGLPTTLFLACVHSSKKVALCNMEDLSRSSFLNYIKDKVYSEIALSDYNAMIVRKYVSVVNLIGDKTYKAEIIKLSYEQKNDKTVYCVVAPGGSALYKCWPLKKFSVIINYIIEHLDIEVYLTGGEQDFSVSSEIIKNIKKKEAVRNLCGQTGYLEWLGLLGNARFVLGNDSAACHAAACVRTRAICIKGQWLGDKYFPYDSDNVEDKKFIPLIVECTKKECAICLNPCGIKNKKVNRACYKDIMEGKSCHCVADVEVETVIKTINTVMDKIKTEGIEANGEDL